MQNRFNKNFSYSLNFSKQNNSEGAAGAEEPTENQCLLLIWLNEVRAIQYHFFILNLILE